MRWSRRRFAGSVLGVAACAADTSPTPDTQRPRPLPATARRESSPRWRGALGPLDDLSSDHARWLADPEGHEPAPARATAVMRRHVELPQSVADYLRSEPHPITSERRTLVLQPLGHFPFDVVEGEDFVGLVRTPALEELAAVIAAGFGLPVEVLPARPLQPSALASRQRGAITQIDARALLSAVKSDLPPHAYAMLTLVNVDLFAVPEQHYAFGWSLHHGRHGIASFARFDPSFHGGWRPDDLEPTILRRSVRLLGHELAHMFGLTHCNYARCLLGPVDVIEDLDALAVQPCAVCQCKLLRGAGIDPIATTSASVAVLERLGLADDSAAAQRRIDRWRGGTTTRGDTHG